MRESMYQIISEKKDLLTLMEDRVERVKEQIQHEELSADPSFSSEVSSLEEEMVTFRRRLNNTLYDPVHINRESKLAIDNAWTALKSRFQSTVSLIH